MTITIQKERRSRREEAYRRDPSLECRIIAVLFAILRLQYVFVVKLREGYAGVFVELGRRLREPGGRRCGFVHGWWNSALPET